MRRAEKSQRLDRRALLVKNRKKRVADWQRKSDIPEKVKQFFQICLTFFLIMV